MPRRSRSFAQANEGDPAVQQMWNVVEIDLIDVTETFPSAGAGRGSRDFMASPGKTWRSWPAPLKRVHGSSKFCLERGPSPGGGKVMSRKRFSAEQIIPKLREAEVEIARGVTVAAAAKKIGVTEQTFYRWKKD
jgi:hypothetical protein